jgi:hypothetical protein
MRNLYSLAVLVLAAAALPSTALAQQYDPMLAADGAIGHGKWTVTVTAGPSGAPNGFVIWWMKRSTFVANNNQWFPAGNGVQAAMYFDGAPSLNTFGGTVSDYLLDPNETVRIEIGDLFDEEGVYGNALAIKELDSSTEYVFCGWAIGDGAIEASAYSNNVFGATTENGEDCQFTQGYWKNHPGAWPVTSVMLGNVLYTQAQLLSIFGTPAQGNGLLILAHQLIAAKLNGAAGADLTPIQDAIDDADALIGNLVVPPVGGGTLDPDDASGLTQELDEFNNGRTETTCNATPTLDSSWGRLKTLYR